MVKKTYHSPGHILAVRQDFVQERGAATPWEAGPGCHAMPHSFGITLWQHVKVIVSWSLAFHFYFTSISLLRFSMIKLLILSIWCSNLAWRKIFARFLAADAWAPFHCHLLCLWLSWGANLLPFPKSKGQMKYVKHWTMSKRTEHQIYPNSKPLRTSPNPAKPILAYHHTPLTRDTLYIEILRHGWVHVSRAVRRVRRVLCRARAVRGATWLSWRSSRRSRRGASSADFACAAASRRKDQENLPTQATRIELRSSSNVELCWKKYVELMCWIMLDLYSSYLRFFCKTLDRIQRSGRTVRWKKWPPFWREKQRKAWPPTLWESAPPTWQSKLAPQQAHHAIMPCHKCVTWCHVSHCVTCHFESFLKDVENENWSQDDPSILLHRRWYGTVGPLFLRPEHSRALCNSLHVRQRAGWPDNCNGTTMDLEDGSRSCFRGRLLRVQQCPKVFANATSDNNSVKVLQL